MYKNYYVFLLCMLPWVSACANNLNKPSYFSGKGFTTSRTLEDY